MKQNVTERISSVEKPSVRSKSPRLAFSKTSELTMIASNLFRCPKNKTHVECANSEYKGRIHVDLRRNELLSGHLSSWLHLTRASELPFHPVTSCSSLSDSAETSEFRNKVVQELQKSMSRIGEENIYNVVYQSETNQTRRAPVCMLLDSKIKLLRKKDSPFNENKLGQLFPKHKLFRKSKGKSCIIVSSAGSLSGSELGDFIGEFTSAVSNDVDLQQSRPSSD